VSLEAVDPTLAVVDRWLDRRDLAGASLRGTLEVLVERRLRVWARGATEGAVVEVREELGRRGFESVGEKLASRRTAASVAPEAAPEIGNTASVSAIPLLRRLTQAHGAEAYEVVEQAFRKSIAKFGARFVAMHARAAIDDTMGPMHATVVAADLLSMLERLDPHYLESLTFALETMHDWGVVVARAAESSDKTRATAKRNTRALSSPKRRA
jgi:hypothetical protein